MKTFALKWLVLALTVLALVTVLIYFKKEKDNRICEQVIVDFDHPQETYLTKAEVLAYLTKDTLKLFGKRTSSINLLEMERILSRNPFIKEATCYLRFDGQIVIDIIQKTAILRVIADDGRQYYIDEDGGVFPISKHYTPLVKVATGPISGDLNNKLYTFTHHVNQSTFWNTFIEQIFVLDNGDIGFTTQIGGHQVVIGDVDRLDGKLSKLLKYYKRAPKYIGWNTYSTINLTYRNQIICKE